VILNILHAGTVQNCQVSALGQGRGQWTETHRSDSLHSALWLGPAAPVCFSWPDSSRGICTVPRKQAVPSTARLGPTSNMTLQTTEKSQMSEYSWNKTQTILPLHKAPTEFELIHRKKHHIWSVLKLSSPPVFYCPSSSGFRSN